VQIFTDPLGEDEGGSTNAETANLAKDGLRRTRDIGAQPRRLGSFTSAVPKSENSEYERSAITVRCPATEAVAREGAP
jgi:hypothetical protein